MSDLGNKEIFAKNLNYYMDLNGKARNDICNDLGFPYSTFTDWTNGNVYPRIDKIEMLANYFGVEKSDLIEDKSKLLDKEDELTQYLDELHKRPEMKMLFKVAKGATKEDVEKAVKIIEMFRNHSSDEDDI
ncbi:helix-turn-helix domain-containing protein [Aminipila luticellarii]|uniref:XRE family transcriptional regulator n=1 Tax=Aminipila luticellarii TaxID=2507160 RepID=A0A410PX63_9FIRM|nr:helix-turn-helix domain-containing protein [Aminipila luticellarii]QAT43476.1 XRE family transcriptional regulator [Aminipila luticellarii]